MQRVVFDCEPTEFFKAGVLRADTEQVEEFGEHDRARTEDANVRKAEFQALEISNHGAPPFFRRAGAATTGAGLASAADAFKA